MGGEAESKRMYLDTGSMLLSAPASAVVAGGAQRPQVIFVLGGPGSGKGTQCARIAEEFGIVHLSTGDLLRDEINDPTSSVKSVIDQHIADGKLVPISIVIGLVRKAIDAYCSQGKFTFLIDVSLGARRICQGGNSMLVMMLMCCSACSSTAPRMYWRNVC